MSMPSSSALVETTARTRALAKALLDLAAALRQIAAAIAANLLVRSRRTAEIVLQIRRQDLGRQAALREHDRLQLALQELGREPARFGQIRPADAELRVDDRRVDEEKELLAARRAALRHELERLLDERLGQLARIGDRRRRADERRRRSVVPADAPQPPQHVRQMTAEHAAIRVQLVDDDVAEVLEQLRPPRMMRQDPGVDHVRVAQHDVRAPANRAPRILRRVAVVGEHADLELVAARELIGQLVQLGELILRERLGRKQIERARRRVAQNRAQHRRVVAERLPRRGRRRHDDVTAGERVLDRQRLVRVELIDAAVAQHVAQTRIEIVAKRRVARLERRQAAHGGDPAVRVVGAVRDSAGEAIEGGGQRLIVRGIGAARRKHG